MLAQVARDGVRRHLARASTTQLLSRYPFAQVAAEEAVETSPAGKVRHSFFLKRNSALKP